MTEATLSKLALLNAVEAYQAATLDYALALRRANFAVESEIVPPADFDRFLADHIALLRNKRIERGELPPWNHIPGRSEG